jgi:hypothetical protein
MARIPQRLDPSSQLVPVVGGVTYVRTGVLKWWLGGVLMGGAYMVCGKASPPTHLTGNSKGGQPASDKDSRI